MFEASKIYCKSSCMPMNHDCFYFISLFNCGTHYHEIADLLPNADLSRRLNPVFMLCSVWCLVAICLNISFQLYVCHQLVGCFVFLSLVMCMSSLCHCLFTIPLGNTAE